MKAYFPGQRHLNRNGCGWHPVRDQVFSAFRFAVQPMRDQTETSVRVHPQKPAWMFVRLKAGWVSDPKGCQISEVLSDREFRWKRSAYQEASGGIRI